MKASQFFKRSPLFDTYEIIREALPVVPSSFPGRRRLLALEFPAAAFVDQCARCEGQRGKHLNDCLELRLQAGVGCE